MPRINMDEIVRGFGSWKNPKDVSKAGLLAVKKLKEYLEAGITFNQETTLCGRSIFRNIDIAKARGYEVILYYVGLDNVEIAKERVRQRVKAGGHGIPEADIERRYSESLENLKKMIPVCDSVLLFDNTESFVKVAKYEHGRCVEKDDVLPKWCEF